MNSICPRCHTSTDTASAVCLLCAAERVLAEGSGTFLAGPPEEPPGWGHGEGEVPVQIGQYEIVEELGSGGMGRVFAARQIGLGRMVALKVVSARIGGPDLELRFLREAQTIARLRHPHIVTVHESGRDGGYLFLSMDYIEGRDLARRLRGGPLGSREAADLVRKVAGALAYTHSQGLLHRDLKPSNILLDGEEPRVADFGLAAEIESQGHLTVATRILGTPHYLAPEAIRSGSAALSMASDVYALGVVLFEALTGRTPFAGASLAELAGLGANSEPPSPRLFAPAIPADLETICLKCLEWEPVRRYSSAAAVEEDLHRFLAGEAIVARPVGAIGQLARWCRRRPALAAVWLLLVLLALGSTVAAILIEREHTFAEAAVRLSSTAEVASKEQLRAANIEEARATLQSDTPGRRDLALADLAQAEGESAGPDLRDAVISALMVPDVRPVDTWDLSANEPVEVTVSPDGNLACLDSKNLAASARGPSRLRRWGDNADIQRLDAPGTRVSGVWRFGGKGRFVMARFLDQTLRVWRVGKAEPLLAVRLPAPGPDPVAYENADYDFNPAGDGFATGLMPSGGVALRRLPDGAETARWTGGEIANVIRYSPDGRLLAAIPTVPGRAGPHRIYLLDAKQCSLAATIEPGACPTQVAWSGDSRLLAVGLADQSVALYDVRDGRLLQRLPDLDSATTPLAVLGGRLFLAADGASDASLRLTPIGLGTDRLSFDAIGPGPIAAAPGSRYFCAASPDNTLTRFEVLAPPGWALLPPPRLDGYRHGFDGAALDFSPDARWVATGHERFTVVRESRTGLLAAEIDSGRDDPADLGGVAFGSEAGVLYRASPTAGLQRITLRASGRGGFAVSRTEVIDPERGFALGARSPDRRRLLLVDPESGRVKIDEVSAEASRTLARWTVPGAFSGAFSPDGSRVILNGGGRGRAPSGGRLRVYRSVDGSIERDLGRPLSAGVFWSADGRIVLTSNGRRGVEFWDAASWTPRGRLTGDWGETRATFALSPDGALAVIQEAKVVHLV